MNQRTILQKILFFPLTKIVIGFIVVTGIYNVSKNFRGGIFKTNLLSLEWNQLITGIIATIVAVFAYIILYHFYEKRKITELSTNKIGWNITVGILLGVILQSLTILVIYLKGGYSVVSINPVSFLIPPLTIAFTSAIIEELLFRGIIFRITEEKLGSYVALAISAIIFGALHLGNPNSSLITGIGLAIQAGLLLGAAYIYTRNLWFPIAIHFAWNFSQSAIFGANVSGIQLSRTLITSEINGAAWLTGGSFGPEGSIQATIFALTATIILLILSQKKGRILKPYWKK